MKPRIVSIATSKKKGTRKTQVDSADLRINHGVIGDGHAGTWDRQVSFLAAERIEECKTRGLNVSFGDFAENVATEGIDWKSVPLGSRFRLGEKAIVEITKIGKECHKKCAIYYQAGDCIMPREGVFARVLEGGTIRCGDLITLLSPFST
jgi:MOSC domain-containing protein YiiM